MAEQKKAAKGQERIIGRWTIGATLGKGGYSWVKRGQDIKTGKIVALKFMEKADVSWVKEQAKQVLFRPHSQGTFGSYLFSVISNHFM